MKCPKCKIQTLKEDYSCKKKNSDTLYCPHCLFTESRKELEKTAPPQNNKRNK